MDKEKMFEEMAKDFKEAIREYRKARREEEVEEYSETLKRRELNSNSKHFIKISKVEYWEDVIKSKIEVVGAIGGFDFMQEFSYYLGSVDNEGLNLESAFCYLADGICNWWY